jgi:hypothetical protein
MTTFYVATRRHKARDTLGFRKIRICSLSAAEHENLAVERAVHKGTLKQPFRFVQH